MRFREIYERIRSSVVDGKLVAGDRLPQARMLAAELNVARGDGRRGFPRLFNPAVCAVTCCTIMIGGRQNL